MMTCAVLLFYKKHVKLNQNHYAGKKSVSRKGLQTQTVMVKSVYK